MDLYHVCVSDEATARPARKCHAQSPRCAARDEPGAGRGDVRPLRHPHLRWQVGSCLRRRERSVLLLFRAEVVGPEDAEDAGGIAHRDLHVRLAHDLHPVEDGLPLAECTPNGLVRGPLLGELIEPPVDHGADDRGSVGAVLTRPAHRTVVAKLPEVHAASEPVVRLLASWRVTCSGSSSAWKAADTCKGMGFDSSSLRTNSAILYECTICWFYWRCF